MPPKPIVKALREAKGEVLKIALINGGMDTLVMTMLLLLGCLLFTLPQWWAFMGGIVYGIVHVRGNLKEVSFANIEKKFPDLKEQLITVADNTKEQNEIIEALNQEVLLKMKKIETSSFLDFGKLTREVSVMAVISFVIIGAAAFNVKFFDINEAIKEIREFKPFQEYDVNEKLLQFEESTNLSEILGNLSVAELGQQQLNLELNPLMSEVEIGTVRPPEERRFREVPPPDIKASSDVSFEEDIPKQYQKIVKTYFKEITKS